MLGLRHQFIEIAGLGVIVVAQPVIVLVGVANIFTNTGQSTRCCRSQESS